MKQELEQALFNDFPNVFRERDDPESRWSIKLFGIEANDGWEPIIRKACEELEPLILAQPQVSRAGYRLVQLKEKFGGLRWNYAEQLTPAMASIVGTAESLSVKTCEACGKPGEILTVGGWMGAACTEHHTARQAEYEARHRAMRDGG